MSARHTPEPWGYWSGQVHSENGDGECIMTAHVNVKESRPPELRQADAARAVACVNACAGLDDAAHEVLRLKIAASGFDQVGEILGLPDKDDISAWVHESMNGGIPGRVQVLVNVCAGYTDPMDLRREAYCARNAESVSTRYTEGHGWTRFFHFAEGTTKTIGVHIHQGVLDWERSGTARAAVDALMGVDHD